VAIYVSYLLLLIELFIELLIELLFVAIDDTVT